MQAWVIWFWPLNKRLQVPPCHFEIFRGDSDCARIYIQPQLIFFHIFDLPPRDISYPWISTPLRTAQWRGSDSIGAVSSFFPFSSTSFTLPNYSITEPIIPYVPDIKKEGQIVELLKSPKWLEMSVQTNVQPHWSPLHSGWLPRPLPN